MKFSFIKNQFSKPKAVLTSGILGLIILGLALFVYFSGVKRETKILRPGEQYGVQYRDPSEIVITDLGNGTKRAEDKRQNYSVVVPSDWNIQEPTAVYDIFNFFDETNGCRFSSGYSETEMTLSDFIDKTDPRRDEFITVKNYSIEDFNNLSGKYTKFEIEETGYFESLDFEKNNHVFSISLGVLDGNREICSQELLQLAESLELR